MPKLTPRIDLEDTLDYNNISEIIDGIDTCLYNYRKVHDKEALIYTSAISDILDMLTVMREAKEEAIRDNDILE